MQKAALITAMVVNHTSRHLRSGEVEEIYELVREARRSSHGKVASTAPHKVAWYLSDKTKSTRLDDSLHWPKVRSAIETIIGNGR